MSDGRPHFRAGFAATLHEVVAEAFDDVDNLLGHAIDPKDAPQTFPVNAVKSLLKVYKLI